MSNQPRSPLSWASLVAAVLSGSSLLACGYLLVQLRAERARVVVCEDVELRKEVAGLRTLTAMQVAGAGGGAIVGTLADRLSKIERHVRLPRPGEPEMPESPPRAPTVKLESPSKSVAIKETAPGVFEVTNTDSKLSGTLMKVKRQAADGTIEELNVVVPPPEGQEFPQLKLPDGGVGPAGEEP